MADETPEQEKQEEMDEHKSLKAKLTVLVDEKQLAPKVAEAIWAAIMADEQAEVKAEGTDEAASGETVQKAVMPWEAKKEHPDEETPEEEASETAEDEAAEDAAGDSTATAEGMPTTVKAPSASDARAKAGAAPEARLTADGLPPEQRPTGLTEKRLNTVRSQ